MESNRQEKSAVIAIDKRPVYVDKEKRDRVVEVYKQALEMLENCKAEVSKANE